MNRAITMLIGAPSGLRISCEVSSGGKQWFEYSTPVMGFAVVPNGDGVPVLAPVIAHGGWLRPHLSPDDDFEGDGIRYLDRYSLNDEEL